MVRDIGRLAHEDLAGGYAQKVVEIDVVGRVIISANPAKVACEGFVNVLIGVESSQTPLHSLGKATF